MPAATLSAVCKVCRREGASRPERSSSPSPRIIDVLLLHDGRRPLSASIECPAPHVHHAVVARRIPGRNPEPGDSRKSVRRGPFAADAAAPAGPADPGHRGRDLLARFVRLRTPGRHPGLDRAGPVRPRDDVAILRRLAIRLRTRGGGARRCRQIRDRDPLGHGSRPPPRASAARLPWWRSMPRMRWRCSPRCVSWPARFSVAAATGPISTSSSSPTRVTVPSRRWRSMNSPGSRHGRV